jgi:hypothetical protein
LRVYYGKSDRIEDENYRFINPVDDLWDETASVGHIGII